MSEPNERRAWLMSCAKLKWIRSELIYISGPNPISNISTPTNKSESNVNETNQTHACFGERDEENEQNQGENHRYTRNTFEIDNLTKI